MTFSATLNRKSLCLSLCFCGLPALIRQALRRDIQRNFKQEVPLSLSLPLRGLLALIRRYCKRRLCNGMSQWCNLLWSLEHSFVYLVPWMHDVFSILWGNLWVVVWSHNIQYICNHILGLARKHQLSSALSQNVIIFEELLGAAWVSDSNHPPHPRSIDSNSGHALNWIVGNVIGWSFKESNKNMEFSLELLAYSKRSGTSISLTIEV